MDRNPSLAPHVVRSAKIALRRTVAAFGLDHSRFGVELTLGIGGDLAVELRYEMGEGIPPFRQERDLRVPRPSARLSDHARAVVCEMVRNVALVNRDQDAGAPTGWSIHPVAASVIAAAGTELPNPADPLSWLRHGVGTLRMADGGNIVGATFSARENVLILDSANIVDFAGLRSRQCTPGVQRSSPRSKARSPRPAPPPWRAELPKASARFSRRTPAEGPCGSSTWRPDRSACPCSPSSSRIGLCPSWPHPREGRDGDRGRRAA